MSETAIPDHIMDAAKECFRAWQKARGVGIVEAVAGALMARDERAARIAEAWTTSSWEDEHFAAMTIAFDIRNPKP